MKCHLIIMYMLNHHRLQSVEDKEQRHVKQMKLYMIVFIVLCIGCPMEIKKY